MAFDIINSDEAYPLLKIDPDIEFQFEGGDACECDLSFHVFMCGKLLDKMISDVVDYSKAAIDSQAIKEFKNAVYEKARFKSQLKFIKEYSRSFNGPMCDENGFWMQNERKVNMQILPAFLAECKQFMNVFCAVNKGKSAEPRFDELKEIYKESFRRRKYFKKKHWSLAAQIFSK